MAASAMRLPSPKGCPPPQDISRFNGHAPTNNFFWQKIMIAKKEGATWDGRLAHYLARCMIMSRELRDTMPLRDDDTQKSGQLKKPL